MNKPKMSTVVGVTSVTIALVIAATSIARAEGESTPLPEPVPVETYTSMPVPPAPSESAVPEEPEPEAPEPEEPAPRLPIASSVLGAVTLAISTYCTTPNGSSMDQSKWAIIDPNAVNITGFWEVWANTPSGAIVVLATPEPSQVLVTASSPVAVQAFAAWGCPSEMAVGRF
jgi:hypothetical protein